MGVLRKTAWSGSPGAHRIGAHPLGGGRVPRPRARPVLLALTRKVKLAVGARAKAKTRVAGRQWSSVTTQTTGVRVRARARAVLRSSGSSHSIPLQPEASVKLHPLTR